MSAILLWELIFALFALGCYFIFDYSVGNSSGLQFRFKNAESLWLLVLLMPFSILFILQVRAHNKRNDSIPPQLIRLLLQPVSDLRVFLKYFFLRNGIVFLIVAMAQPSFGNKKVSGTIRSMEIALCLDVSNSMNAKDITNDASRLDVAKRAMSELINRLSGEKIGVTLFAGNAFVQLPLTTDYDAAKMFIEEIETGMISKQGTNFSDALLTTTQMFSPSKTSKVILLVTDGEDHEEYPKEALEKIREANIHLCALGLGSQNGGPIPLDPLRPEIGYKKTESGQLIISKMNPELIESIANDADGLAQISSDPFPDLTGMLTEINQMKRTKLRDLEFEIQENRYQLPLGISIACFLIYFMLGNKLIRHENA
jgi:Ca-activated chloride channel family protein